MKSHAAVPEAVVVSESVGVDATPSIEFVGDFFTIFCATGVVSASLDEYVISYIRRGNTHKWELVVEVRHDTTEQEGSLITLKCGDLKLMQEIQRELLAAVTERRKKFKPVWRVA